MPTELSSQPRLEGPGSYSVSLTLFRCRCCYSLFSDIIQEEVLLDPSMSSGERVGPQVSRVFGWRRVIITVELSLLEGRLALVIWPFFGL